LRNEIETGSADVLRFENEIASCANGFPNWNTKSPRSSSAGWN
jgi:hypothetical protein